MDIECFVKFEEENLARQLALNLLNLPIFLLPTFSTIQYICIATVDRENFVVKKVTWDKSLTHFNFVKAVSIECMSTEELHC